MSSKSQNPDSTMGYQPHDPNQDTDFIDTSGSQSEPDITNYEPDLVQIDDPDDQTSSVNHKQTLLKEEHTPRCRRCHYTLLGMPQAKGVCPQCGKLFDLERPRTYTTYASHRCILLITSHTSGTIPLFMTLLALLGYVLSQKKMLLNLNLLSGSVLMSLSVVLLLLYLTRTKIPFKYKARRTLFCLAQSLCNFPLWWLSFVITH